MCIDIKFTAVRNSNIRSVWIHFLPGDFILKKKKKKIKVGQTLSVFPNRLLSAAAAYLKSSKFKCYMLTNVSKGTTRPVGLIYKASTTPT